MQAYVPFIQLGFAAVMAIMLFVHVRNTSNSLLKQNAEMSAKITLSLENHLSSVARSLTLVEENLRHSELRAQQLIPVFFSLKDGIDLIKSALVQSTIVPPGTKVSIEPVLPNMVGPPGPQGPQGEQGKPGKDA